jgi:hypothetical protein
MEAELTGQRDHRTDPVGVRLGLPSPTTGNLRHRSDNQPLPHYSRAPGSRPSSEHEHRRRRCPKSPTAQLRIDKLTSCSAWITQIKGETMGHRVARDLVSRTYYRPHHVRVAACFICNQKKGTRQTVSGPVVSNVCETVPSQV